MYRPSDLLPAVAFESTRIADRGVSSPNEVALQWALADIARVSALYGNEHRVSSVDNVSIQRLARSHANVLEPFESGDSLRMLTRMAYEQFPFQEPDWSLIGRSRALLVEGLTEVPGLRVMSGSAMKEMLGAPLDQAVGAALALWAVAQVHGGWIAPSIFDDPQLHDLMSVVPREALESRIRSLTTSITEARNRQSTRVPPQFEKYSFNFLRSTPLLQWSDGRLLAPVPRFILWSVTPASLYFVGAERYKRDFTEDLGRLVEHYVGRQLELTGAVVVSEIEYKTSDGHKKSVDYLVVWDDLVVLVEAKSTRLREEDRAGGVSLAGQLDKILGKAYEQIYRSKCEIVNRNPAFDCIPWDRPIIGLVVTAEPLYLANSRLYEPPAASWEGAPPTVVASLADLETLVVTPAGMRQHLIDVVADRERSTWYLGLTFPGDGSAIPANPIIEHAWRAYPLTESHPRENRVSIDQSADRGIPSNRREAL